VVQHDYDPDKLAELILLTAGHLNRDPTYGSTKLNKALFLAEFLHYKRHGNPISGATYERLPRAPAPRDLQAVRQRLLDDRDAVMETRGYLGHLQHRLLPLREARRGRLRPTEVQLVSEVCHALRGHSHSNVLGWQLAGEREEIPYESSFLSTATPVRADLEWGRALAEDRGLVGAGGGGGKRRNGGTAAGLERALRSVSYECRVDHLRSGYLRGMEVLAGIEWACARWPDGVHRLPGTRLHLLKTEWPIPSLRAFFTLDGESRCTVWAVEEFQPYAPEEDGTD